MAESDLGLILEDEDTGFGWPISLTDPAGNTAPLTGFSGDISEMIDPDTGMYVSGRQAFIVLRNSSIYAALPGSGLPVHIANSQARPWVVTFDDINGLPYTFKVSDSMPDRTIGLTKCALEVYTL